MILTLPAVSSGEEPTSKPAAIDASLNQEFSEQIRPLLTKHCADCHNEELMTSGIRVDHLTGELPDKQLRLWMGIRKQIESDAMPPEEEAPLSPEEKETLIGWIDRAEIAVRSRERDKNGSVRRLTVAQYRNSLRDLLGVEDDFTDILPPDAVSKDGFLNNAESMLLSPVLLEAYFEIAEKMLDAGIVDEATPPAIQNFRMDLGQGINPEPCPDDLILGANSHLLKNPDFMVTQLTPEKSFPFEPRFMTTQYRFIEGYQGNDTVRGWREYDSIYHAVFACMRGAEGYPKGNAYQSVPQGLLLRPAIPSTEIFQVGSTYGPKANFKMSLRELPENGDFRVKVTAAKYNDGLLLERRVAEKGNDAPGAIVITKPEETQAITIPEAGIYQIDIHPTPEENKNQKPCDLVIGDRFFSNKWEQPAFIVVRLAEGEIPIRATLHGIPLERMQITRLSDSEEAAQEFVRFEKRDPILGVYLGLRRDCGSTLAQVEKPVSVSSTELQTFEFRGAIRNYPRPEVEKNNVNYLAGIKEIGVRSEYTDGRDRPQLLLRSVEFEGPYYEAWPPVTHQQIFILSEHKDEPATYAREIISNFANRAYRRPATEDEIESTLQIWKAAYSETGDFNGAIKQSLLVVLTSPQFLFLIENSTTPAAEPLGEFELASKLSYFLWNSAPDAQTQHLAATHQLRQQLDQEIDRMIADSRFEDFLHPFASQWLSLDKLDVVETDREMYPRLTRDVKAQLRAEPAALLKHLFRENLPVANLVRSDLVVANEVTADYYGLDTPLESGFDFEPVPHHQSHLGGVISQASVLAGLSNGKESNPIKRGAWLARKIVAEPPDDPPPNVPALDEDLTQLTLRERLELHRNQKGCVQCHTGIDPWGFPFEEYDAGGLFKRKQEVDSKSDLPDGTHVAGMLEFKDYLAEERQDQVAFSFLKHLMTYAVGRTLTYNEIEFIRQHALELKPQGYPMKKMLHFVVQSPIFLEK
ncbi:MAG: hypothetical protein CMJ46_10420 [Planctomyces sp.]|nr:hypothetical protein [Planctomyces sp.]